MIRFEIRVDMRMVGSSYQVVRYTISTYVSQHVIPFIIASTLLWVVLNALLMLIVYACIGCMFIISWPVFCLCGLSLAAVKNCYVSCRIPIQPIVLVGFENIASMWFKREQITTQSHTFSECFISTRWQFRLEQYNIAKQCLINVTKYLYGVTKPSYGLISKTKMNRKRNNHKRTIQKNQTRILANN